MSKLKAKAKGPEEKPKAPVTLDPIVAVMDYESNLECPKCQLGRKEEPGIDVVWHNGGPRCVNGVTYEIPKTFECLAMKCQGCGYQWLMQTSDADDRLEAEKAARELEESEENPEEPETPAVEFKAKAKAKAR